MGWAAYSEARSKTIEADVDDRSAIQRQDLGHEEPTCDGNAERCSQLRARTPTKGQRKHPEQRSEGGHHEWPEAEQPR